MLRSLTLAVGLVLALIITSNGYADNAPPLDAVPHPTYEASISPGGRWHFPAHRGASDRGCYNARGLPSARPSLDQPRRSDDRRL